ncbi:DUF4148 domain-containing protein [Paraburkholderia sp. CNPSo 3157]|uniref:DUF4148 domain-containing protein n=1 Tax=Paraburkholderia franconis TaxID=2654983 RepID=A0A7X1TJJ0_9BURK|nr:DUF4148 domain-containing protein [Paraburkholderia franconis]MPW21521.1 DUF4148 domain-containing protein [Paraburkholderia franconis]
MKMLANTVIIASVAALPIVSFAQQATSVTRAQVKSDLSELEKAGYDIAGSDLDYPGNLKSAEAKLAAQQDATARRRAVQSGYGSTITGTSNSGAR